jgi:roadblock/LC7 domain-containing protein
MFANKRAALSSRPSMSAFQLPAPTGGLNLLAGIAEMGKDEALILDNWFPAENYCRVRGGYTSHATGIGASVGTLMEHAGKSARKMFAATATDIYDVSSAGAVGAAAVTSLTNAYWQQTMFATSGGQFLVICNGADSVRNYDGSSWSTPAITGVTSADLINVWSYKSRLWFVEKDSTKAWYLGTASIAGAATSIEFGDKFKLGGKLKLICSVSRDAGNGPQEVICFISSRGEVLVYEGDDPGASGWALVGAYYAAPPIGNRAVVRVDGDAAMLTEKGVISLRQLAAGGQAGAERQAITNMVALGIGEDFASYGSNTGWEMVVHQRTRQMVINVPKSSSTATQYAMNIRTGKWCTYGRFDSPLNATTWGQLSEDLYFATSGGTVYKAESGYQDAGAAITAQMKTSFQEYENGALFRMSLVRPMFTAGGRVIPGIRINVDYRNDVPTSSDQYPGVSGAAGAVWDTDLWDTGIWGDSEAPYADWVAAHGIGTAASLHMITQTSGHQVRLNAIDYKVEKSRGIAL